MPLLTVFYSTGGDGPLISYYGLYEDGWIQQVNIGNKKKIFKLNLKEFDSLKHFLVSRNNQEVWSYLDFSKGKLRCCDYRFVEISFGVHHFFLTEGEHFSIEEILLIQAIDSLLIGALGNKYIKWGRIIDILE